MCLCILKVYKYRTNFLDSEKINVQLEIGMFINGYEHFVK